MMTDGVNENSESYKNQSGFPPGQNELGGVTPKDKVRRSQVEKASDHSPDCDALTYFHKEKDFEEKHNSIERQKKRSIVLAPISDDARKHIHSIIDAVIQHKHHRHCLGTLLLIHNDTAPPAMHDFKILVGMGKGVEKLKFEFEKLGFAVVWLKNPTSAEVQAAMDYLSSEEVIRTFPESFKFFGVYVTCHGNDRTFFTKDGSIAYDSVASMAKRDSLQKSLQLFLFIFDCCRSNPVTDIAEYPDGKTSEGVPDLPESNMGPNTMILYAQSGGGTTWGPGDGITYMAHDLLKLIGTHIHLRSLPAKLRESIKKRGLPSTMILPCHETLHKEFILVKERDDRMAPRLKDVVVISSDGAVAELHVNPRPSVNPTHFEHEEFKVQMRPSSTENWLSLQKYRETSRKYTNDYQEPWSSSSGAASFGSLSNPPSLQSSSTDGKVIITAVLPVDHRTRDSIAEFRVISKMSGGICLPSNVAEVTLPEMSRPEITKTIVCLKDCHSLEVETAWRLENKPALPLSKFFVHVFKNNIKVHTTEVLAVRNKAEFSIKFFVPEVIEHETGAMYEVCVEAEREHDSMTIPSNRMKAPNPERHFPSLKEVRIAEDGATATATVWFESVLNDETLNEQQYELEAKIVSEREWKPLTKFQTSTPSEPVPIGNSGRQSPISLQESASIPSRQPATPDLRPRSTSTDSTDAHRMTLTALLPLDRKKCKVHFRVVSKRHNSLSIPSSTSPTIDLEEIDDNFNLPLPACKNLALSTIDALNRSSVDVEQTHQTCFFYYWLREGEFPLPIDAGGIFQFPNYYYWLARRLQLVQGCFISQVVHQHEEPAKPQVLAGHIRFYNCRRPMATVKWKIQVPLSIQLSKFTVRIYREDEGDEGEALLCSEDVPYKSDEVDYCLKIPSAELTQTVGRVNQYTVCIEATRIDNKGIKSDRVYVTTKPELCSGVWTRKCVCCVTAIIIFIIGLVLASILIITINPHYLQSGIPWAPANLVSEIPKPSIDSLSSPLSWLKTTDFTQEIVKRGEDDELTIYCAEIEIERLRNHQKVNYKLSFMENDQILTKTAFLPLSLASPVAYYVLSQSKMFVYLCLSDREEHPQSVQLLLYKRVDQNSWEPENNVVVASQNVTFSSSCTNTTVVAPESAVVYLALSSPVSVSFKSIIGNVKQFYYDETALDIKNVTNIVSTEDPKVISGSSSKKLVCYVSRDIDEESIFFELVFLCVPLVWKTDWKPVFIFACIFSLLFSLSLCVCITLSSVRACRKHGTYRILR